MPELLARDVLLIRAMREWMRVPQGTARDRRKVLRKMNVQHSMRNDSWRTPPDIIALVRQVLGVIELDPASSALANETVRAEHYLTREDDALTTLWSERRSVYLNPPGGKLGNQSLVRLFWRELMAYRSRGHLTHGIFAMFSVEGLQTTQGDHPCAMDFPICIPAKRVRWVHPTEVKTSPSHSNAFIYVPGTVNRTSDFINVFQQLGACKR